jgi:hypothetical protein
MEALLSLRAWRSVLLTLVSPHGIALLAVGLAVVVSADQVLHGAMSLMPLLLIVLAASVCIAAVVLYVRRMPWRSLGAGALALLTAWAALALLTPAYAQSGGVDVTDTLRDLANIVVPGVLIAIGYYVRQWMKEHTGGQSEALDWNAFNAFLQAKAHSEINGHLLAGKPITIDTKSVLGNQLVGAANSEIAMEIKRLGLSDQTVATYAEAAVAQVLNMMPSAPPFVPASKPVTQGASS